MIASSEANFIDIKAISKVRFVVELTFGSRAGLTEKYCITRTWGQDPCLAHPPNGLKKPGDTPCFEIFFTKIYNPLVWSR